MKKMQLVNLGKGLNRNEMRKVNGGGARSYPNNNNTGICKGVWVDCLCVSAEGKPFICKSCFTSKSGQC
ncbi:hypothetical protein [Flavobacterium aestivum]|uniref:hypothetical protein n=1 Tax=Flavobacterium aestivum TaxID=3003257 RepID=UPI0024832181|nr:hypothetical protein [Flavobacterium aestivum]